MLIWVSYSVNNLHVVAVVLQEASLKMGPNMSLKFIMFQYVHWSKSEKCVSSNVIHHHENPIEWHGCYASSVLSKLGSIPFFGNLSWHWREGDVVTSAQFKDSLLLYAVQTVEKMVDIFIRDRALEECALWRSQYGCWSATSSETSVYDVIYMHLGCCCIWWPYKERSLIMWEHLKRYFSCQNT